ncbi:hypothetical protein HX794_23630 [Pseudomonas costantinii]|uniref:hypothetical protein n=1 Tax=Pseudomonas costantinii TaxID=168469 RepID=UPI0015A25D4B|nr:hypothetical protein [Pseudomonas costantinii]NVZ22640.1 hypothetical protein [Pseudomonas costantinii]
MNVTQLVDQILPDVPGAVIASIRDGVAWALRELCTEAPVWKVSVDLVEGEQSLVVGPGLEAIRLQGLFQGGRPAFCHVFQPTPVTAIVTHAPPGLTGDVVVRPTFGSTEAVPPEWLLDRHCEALTLGALSWLRKMPNKPWSDMQRAMLDQVGFYALCTNARSEALAGNQYGSTRMRVPRFQ